MMWGGAYLSILQDILDILGEVGVLFLRIREIFSGVKFGVGVGLAQVNV